MPDSAYFFLETQENSAVVFSSLKKNERWLSCAVSLTFSGKRERIKLLVDFCIISTRSKEKRN
jgi:hypothetical protein